MLILKELIETELVEVSSLQLELENCATILSI